MVRFLGLTGKNIKIVVDCIEILLSDLNKNIKFVSSVIAMGTSIFESCRKIKV
jgi:hypothetical protein